jgi:hypothetical protein
MRNSNPNGPRKDLSTVVVERPRGGQDGNANNRAYRRTVKSKKNFEDLPDKESVHKPHKFGGWSDERKVHRKDDFLSPIKGFLRKSVGRPWDKVWSELRSMLNGRTTMHQHVLDHVKQYVETSPMFIEGRVCNAISYVSGVPNELRNGDYYVSEHGILRRYKRPKGDGFRRRGVRTYYEKVVRKGDREDYRKIGGLWFYFRYDHLYPYQTLYDAHLGRHVTNRPYGPDLTWKVVGDDNWRLDVEYGKPRHNGSTIFGANCVRVCVEKRQLSKKQIKDLDLANVRGLSYDEL